MAQCKKKSCSPHLETIFIDCKLFYSPQECYSFILVSVYISPQVCVSMALEHLADQITNTEHKHSGSLLFVLGDFNRANLSQEMLKFREHMKCPTSDHCKTSLEDVHCSVPHGAWNSAITAWLIFKPTCR